MVACARRELREETGLLAEPTRVALVHRLLLPLAVAPQVKQEVPSWQPACRQIQLITWKSGSAEGLAGNRGPALLGNAVLPSGVTPLIVVTTAARSRS